MGTASLVIGIIAFLSAFIPSGAPGILLGLLAVVLGLVGRGRLLEEGRSAGVALGGIVIGVLAFIIGATNLALCLFVCNRFEEESGQEFAEQMAQQIQAQVNEQAAQQGMPNMPQVPTTPTPGAVPTPGTGPTPGAPIAGAQVVMVNSPVSGTFAPGLPQEPDSGRPYIDYTLTVPNQGTYSINLSSSNSSNYDPYLRLLLNGAEVANDDDSGGYPNAQINRPLAPGTYVVRVSSFRQQIAAATPFTLSISAR